MTAAVCSDADTGATAAAGGRAGGATVATGETAARALLAGAAEAGTGFGLGTRNSQSRRTASESPAASNRRFSKTSPL
jgi:hypothetical protein